MHRAELRCSEDKRETKEPTLWPLLFSVLCVSCLASHLYKTPLGAQSAMHAARAKVRSKRDDSLCERCATMQTHHDSSSQESGSSPDRPCPAASGGPPAHDRHILFYFKDGEWYAECLDLNLLVANEDILAALRELLVEVRIYLESFAEAGEWSDCVPRNAPLRHWLKYYVVTFVQELRRWLIAPRPARAARANHILVDPRWRPVGA